MLYISCIFNSGNLVSSLGWWSMAWIWKISHYFLKQLDSEVEFLACWRPEVYFFVRLNFSCFVMCIFKFGVWACILFQIFHREESYFIPYFPLLNLCPRLYISVNKVCTDVNFMKLGTETDDVWFETNVLEVRHKIVNVITYVKLKTNMLMSI